MPHFSPNPAERHDFSSYDFMDLMADAGMIPSRGPKTDQARLSARLRRMYRR